MTGFVEVVLNLVTGEGVNLLALNLQMSGPGPASLGSQVHAAAVNGDRSTLLKLITGNSTSSSFSARRCS